MEVLSANNVNKRKFVFIVADDVKWYAINDYSYMISAAFYIDVRNYTFI